jgi:hypothetical protein
MQEYSLTINIYSIQPAKTFEDAYRSAISNSAKKNFFSFIFSFFLF